MLAGVFGDGGQRIGAIGQKHVGLALGDYHAVSAAAGRHRGARRSAYHLQRFCLEGLERAGHERLRLAEDLPRIISGGIGYRCRGRELDLRIEHARKQVRGIEAKLAPCQDAHLIACKQHDRAASPYL
jgi:hypothetical protein